MMIYIQKKKKEITYENVAIIITIFEISKQSKEKRKRKVVDIYSVHRLYSNVKSCIFM